MIIKFVDYEQITPSMIEEIREQFASSCEYVDGILAKRSAKEWAESCAGLCALYEAMKEAGIDVKTAKIERLALGKPVFANLNYHFNISHSCGRAVCVLSEKEVGVDIEFLKKARNFDYIAKNFFCVGEQKNYFGSANGAEEFYRIWTRKEALLKKCAGDIEHETLKEINTYDYSEVTFTEIKKGGYIITVCEA